MNTYVIKFHDVWKDLTLENAGRVEQSFDRLKDAREYAREFTNANIYRCEWTSNGWTLTRKLKNM